MYKLRNLNCGIFSFRTLLLASILSQVTVLDKWMEIILDSSYEFLCENFMKRVQQYTKIPLKLMLAPRNVLCSAVMPVPLNVNIPVSIYLAARWCSWGSREEIAQVWLKINSEIVSMNKVVETLDQPRRNCPVNHAELRHDTFHHASFHNLYTASSAIFLLANVCRVVPAFCLTVNWSVMLYAAIHNVEGPFYVARLLDAERTTTSLQGNRLCHPLCSAQFGDESGLL
jgi:hypothetical protein